MKKIIGLIASCIAFNAIAESSEVKTTDVDENRFPASWVGNWSGKCVNSGSYEFLMDLDVEQLDQGYRWKITYHLPNQTQVRDYTLLKGDLYNAHYVIDENNGIKINNTFIADELSENLFSMFQVGNSSLVATYQREGHEMTLTIPSFNTERTNVSGGENGIPEVTDWYPSGYQNCRLYR